MTGSSQSSNQSFDPAKPFADMSERILRNPNEFGGAMVMVLPDGQLLTPAVFTPKPDVVSFFALIKSHIEVMEAEILDKSRKNDPFAAMRR